jgi:hypothetical protein
LKQSLERNALDAPTTGGIMKYARGSWGAALVSIALLGGVRDRDPAGQSADHARPTRARVTVSRRARRMPRTSRISSSRVLGRRHARGRVFVRCSRISPAHRDRGTARQNGQPARRGRRDHGRIGRQLHCAGVRACTATSCSTNTSSAF